MPHRLKRLIGTQWPLIQAPMAGVQGSALCIAVSRAGALGSMPAAMQTPQTLQAELQRIRDAGIHAYNVNFFVHPKPVADAVAQSRWRGALAPFYDEFGIDPASVSDGPLRQPMDEAMVDVLEQFKPPVVSFHFGLPSPALLDRIRHWKPTLMSSATTIEEGLYLQANGIDVVIAQGLEAGGHRGLFLSSDLSTQMGTLSLTRQLVKSLTIPVVAAGGIADADCTRAALAIGAAGVQVGTSFLLADEADTSPVHRAALQSPQRTHTALTTVFTGRPARGIVNRFMRDMGYLHPDAPPFPAATPAMTPLRTRAESQGSGDFSPLWASQNTSACRAQPAAQIVAELAEAFSTPTTD